MNDQVGNKYQKNAILNRTDKNLKSIQLSSIRTPKRPIIFGFHLLLMTLFKNQGDETKFFSIA